MRLTEVYIVYNMQGLPRYVQCTTAVGGTESIHRRHDNNIISFGQLLSFYCLSQYSTIGRGFRLILRDRRLRW